MNQSVTGVILAGGEGRRAGGRDKGLIDYDGKSLVERAIECLRPQVDFIVISANRNVERYKSFGYPVVVDQVSGFQGPLAGISAALKVVETSLMVVVPCDGVRFPEDLASRLLCGVSDSDGAEISFARDHERSQYLYAAMQASLSKSLEDYLSEGGRAVRRWYESRHSVAVDFSEEQFSFNNLNEI